MTEPLVEGDPMDELFTPREVPRTGLHGFLLRGFGGGLLITALWIVAILLISALAALAILVLAHAAIYAVTLISFSVGGRP